MVMVKKGTKMQKFVVWNPEGNAVRMTRAELIEALALNEALYGMEYAEAKAKYAECSDYELVDAYEFEGIPLAEKGI